MTNNGKSVLTEEDSESKKEHLSHKLTLIMGYLYEDKSVISENQGFIGG